jgi:hypothetical protein
LHKPTLTAFLTGEALTRNQNRVRVLGGSPVRVRPMVCGTRFLNSTCGSIAVAHLLAPANFCRMDGERGALVFLNCATRELPFLAIVEDCRGHDLLIMRLIINSLNCVALGAIAIGLTGCQSPKVVAHLDNGYEEINHEQHFSFEENPVPRTSFEQKGTNGQTRLIWPALYGVKEVVHEHTAIFVGDRGYIEAGEKVTHPRLFAVNPPEPPLDITDEILWRWSKISNNNFAKAEAHFSLATPEIRDGRLALHLEFYPDEKNWPDTGYLQLDWNQVSEIMRAVKQKGVPEKDLRWHTPFIGEEFNQP